MFGEKVSVIMPTYKRDRSFMETALESLLIQSYENLEIVIVDDSPADYELRSEVEEYIKSIEDKNIVYVKNKVNMGGALARNEGIKKATGKYITFLDDDDKYLPDKVLNQVQYMESGDYDMSLSNMLIYNTKGELIDVRKHEDISQYNNKELLVYHLKRHLTGTPTFMYKAEKLRKIGGFDHVKMGQEFVLMLKSIEHGLKIGYMKDTYDVVVLRHGDSISTGKNKISGERELYERKKKYFDGFSLRDRMFIRMRHYAVLAVAYKRNGMILPFLFYCIVAFFSSPLDVLKEVVRYFKTINEKEKELDNIKNNQG